MELLDLDKYEFKRISKYTGGEQSDGKEVDWLLQDWTLIEELDKYRGQGWKIINLTPYIEKTLGGADRVYYTVLLCREIKENE